MNHSHVVPRTAYLSTYLDLTSDPTKILIRNGVPREIRDMIMGHPFSLRVTLCHPIIYCSECKRYDCTRSAESIYKHMYQYQRGMWKAIKKWNWVDKSKAPDPKFFKPSVCHKCEALSFYDKALDARIKMYDKQSYRAKRMLEMKEEQRQRDEAEKRWLQLAYPEHYRPAKPYPKNPNPHT